MRNIDKLLEVMAALRDPQTGCPWDIEQDFASIAPYTIEEAYEVADAIDRDDMHELRGELGDLLLQVVFHSQMAAELKLFDFEDVAGAISEKLIRRHPHVFAGEVAGSADEQHTAWEAQKAAEREAAGKSTGGALDGLTRNLPALTLAAKTSKKAAAVGFDWPDADAVMEKVKEETDELNEARDREDATATEEELGDLLLALSNLARHLQIDPEQALRKANAKFVDRFNRLENALQESGETWEQLSPAELEARWQGIKQTHD